MMMTSGLSFREGQSRVGQVSMMDRLTTAMVFRAAHRMCADGLQMSSRARVWYGRTGRSLESENSAGNRAKLSGSTAAAQGPSVRTTRPTPQILSAIAGRYSQVPPTLLLGGGGPLHPRFLGIGTHLRSVRTPFPLRGNQQSFSRAAMTFPRATGADSGMGAAIQRSAARGSQHFKRLAYGAETGMAFACVFGAERHKKGGWL